MGLCLFFFLSIPVSTFKQGGTLEYAISQGCHCRFLAGNHIAGALPIGHSIPARQNSGFTVLLLTALFLPRSARTERTTKAKEYTVARIMGSTNFLYENVRN